MSIEEVKMFKTNDGELFTDKEKAENHIINIIQQDVDVKLFRNLNEDNISDFNNEQICSIINFLFSDIDRCNILRIILNDMLINLYNNKEKQNENFTLMTGNDWDLMRKYCI